MNGRFPLAGVCAAISISLACSDNAVEPGNDPALAFSADSVSVDVGAFASVSISLSKTNVGAQFISRDETVATVNAAGAIKGVGVGTTYIVASLSNRDDVRDSVRVRVAIDTCLTARPDFGTASESDRELFAYDRSAPLNLQKAVSANNGVFELSDISYTSPPGGIVTGILVEPVGRSGLRPAMVILHPSGLNAKGMAPYSQLIASHGAVVIAIDAPYWRRGGTAALLFSAQDRVEQIQLMMDLQRAVDVLLANPNVDPERIAFEGYSYGGILGAGFVGIERRLKAAVLAAAMGGQVTGATNPVNISFFGNLSCATRNAWLRNMTPIEPIRFVSNAAPTELLFQMGRYDTAVFLEDAQTLYNAASEPKEFRIYDTGHGLNNQALYDRYDWLREKIGLDPRNF